LVLLSPLLFKFNHEPILEIVEMLVLETSELLQLSRPDGEDIRLSPGSGYNRAGNQVLVHIDQLMVLETEESEEIHVFFHQVHAPLFTHRTLVLVIRREQYTLGHEDLQNIEEGGEGIHLKPNLVEDCGLHGHQLILPTVEPHILHAHISL
jgi:hypothetical protein